MTGSQKRKLDPAPVDGKASAATSKHGMHLRSQSRSAVSPPKQPPADAPGAETRMNSPSGEKESGPSYPPYPIQRTIPPRYRGEDREEQRKSAMARNAWREQEQAALLQEQDKKLCKSLGNPDRRIPPPKGLTRRELDICSPYLTKQAFEFSEISDGQKRYKTGLDQVRVSPYQVKVEFRGSRYLPGFVPINENDMERVPDYRELFEEAVRLVITVKERHRLYTVEDGYNNIIKLKWNWLLSVHVRDPTGTLQTVEALFWKSPGAPLKLLEWKIKQGSEVVFCSVRMIT